MKRYGILLLLGLAVLLIVRGCRRDESTKTEELCDELRNSVMMTPVFDSLVEVASGLPKFMRAKVLLVAGTSYSMKIEQLKRAKEYLKEAYRIGSREQKNKVSLELVRLYGTLMLQEKTNWWLIFVLVVTVGVITLAGVYTWVSWGKLRDKK